MHFSTLTGSVAAVLAYTTAAFDLPDDAPYGQYLIPILSNGTQSGEAIFIKPIEVTEEPVSRRSSSITPRNILPYSSINCSWRPITASAYNLVKLQVQEWCDGGGHVPANFAWFWYASSAEGYMCNYSGNPQGCSSAEYDEALDLIAGQCSIDVAGWVGIDAWAKSYGIDNNGVSQCW